MKQVTCGPVNSAGGLARRGFTTIELLIAMVVLGLLLAVALPSYQSSLRKSRRSEAISALTNIQQAQERHRSTNDSFTTLITEATTATPAGLGLPATVTPSGFYNLVISTANPTTYVATATAVSGTSQYNDGDCATMAVRMQGGNLRYGSGASIDWSAANTDPKRCWAR